MIIQFLREVYSATYAAAHGKWDKLLVAPLAKQCDEAEAAWRTAPCPKPGHLEEKWVRLQHRVAMAMREASARAEKDTQRAAWR